MESHENDLLLKEQKENETLLSESEFIEDFKEELEEIQRLIANIRLAGKVENMEEFVEELIKDTVGGV